MRDPSKKQYYQAQARKLALPNAYTAALTDFMRKPSVDVVTRKGQRVVVRAGKKGFALASVKIIATDSNSVTLATYKTSLSNECKNEWVTHIPIETDVDDHSLLIVVKDQAGNIIRHRSYI
jgi:hypothetical protein